MKLQETGSVAVESRSVRGRFRRGFQILGVTVTILLAVGTLTSYWALRKTREVPEFYRQATQQPPRDIAQASRQMESQVERLATRVGRLGNWDAEFTEDQINAWLIQQLPLEFSQVLPKGVEEPRVAIRDGEILAAARYRDSRIETVVSFRVGVKLTAEPNVLAVEISDLKAGALPLPLSRFVTHISKRAARDSLKVEWDSSEDGHPIALVTVPSEHPKYARKPVVVESVTIADGRIHLSGHTGPQAYVAYQPRTAVYQLASLRRHSHQAGRSAEDDELRKKL